jgi:hypothetical protein
MPTMPTTPTVEGKPANGRRPAKPGPTKAAEKPAPVKGKRPVPAKQPVKPPRVEKPAQPQRVQIYPSEEERAQGTKYIWVGCYGENAMKVQDSKDLLGWTVVKAKEGSHFTDRLGNHVVCENNLINREIDWGKVEQLVSVHLRKHADGKPCWEFNGEDILIGMYGSVLNGQKSMIAHVLADQDRELDPEGKGRFWGSTAITMEKGIKYGLSEEDRVVNTLDTAQPRTLKDVMYRSEYFQDMTVERRSTASKIGGYAVKMVWSRTGAGSVAFSPYMTHDAACEFLDRHPRILDAVRWVAEKNKGQVEVVVGVGDDGQLKKGKRGVVERIIEPTRAAAILYLMGMSATNSAAYRYAKPAPSEDAVDDSRWQAAIDFWEALIHDDPALDEVRSVLHGLGADNPSGRASPDERVTVLWLAWKLWLEGTPVDDPALVTPTYTRYTDPETGVTETYFTSRWNFGGVDILRKLNPAEGDEEDRGDGAGKAGRAAPTGPGAVGSTAGGGGDVTRPTPSTPEEKLAEMKRESGFPPDNMTPAEERAWRERIDAKVAEDDERKRQEGARRRAAGPDGKKAGKKAKAREGAAAGS